MKNLKEKIKLLIESNKEGDYWDFKRQWHKENGTLLHDILCFANTIHDKDCFIIFGYDEQEGVVGVKDDYRKKQADILDMLSNIKFAGDNPPRVSIETIIIRKKEVDVLIIHNSYDLPFFVTKDYKHICKTGLIYSRIGDKNTPKNETTNLIMMKRIWEKRFRINKSAIDQFKYLLDKKEQWEENGNGWYNIYRPSLQIVELYDETDRNRLEFYSYHMYSDSTMYKTLYLMSNASELKEFQVIILDGGRYQTIAPDWEYFRFSNRDRLSYSYKYYIENTLNHKIYEFLIDYDSHEYMICKRKFEEIIITFKSAKEQAEVHLLLRSKKEKFLEAVSVTETQLDQYNYIEPDNKEYRKIILERINTGIYINKIVKEFRQEM